MFCIYHKINMYLYNLYFPLQLHKEVKMHPHNYSNQTRISSKCQTQDTDLWLGHGHLAIGRLHLVERVCAVRHSELELVLQCIAAIVYVCDLVVIDISHHKSDGWFISVVLAFNLQLSMTWRRHNMELNPVLLEGRQN